MSCDKVESMETLFDAEKACLAMREVGMSIVDVAEVMGVSESLIKDILEQKRQPSIMFVVQFAYATGVTVSFLYGKEPDQKGEVVTGCQAGEAEAELAKYLQMCFDLSNQLDELEEAGQKKNP